MDLYDIIRNYSEVDFDRLKAKSHENLSKALQDIRDGTNLFNTPNSYVDGNNHRVDISAGRSSSGDNLMQLNVQITESPVF